MNAEKEAEKLAVGLKDKFGKTEIEGLEIGWIWENYRPSVLYYIGHPNHWNTSDFEELVDEIGDRTKLTEDYIKESLISSDFPVQSYE